jgi:DNA polymerase-3 subunit delta'
LHQHPDYLFVTQEKNKKTGKTKKYIDVSQIRRVNEWASRYAAMGGYKIVIIDGAEKLNENASNALLKTLEEPSKKTIFFLITKSTESLLPTIFSRVQSCYFYPVESTVLERYIESDHKEYEHQAKEMVAMSHGCPGLLINWVTQADVYTKHRETLQDFVSLFFIPYHAKIKQVQSLFSEKDDHIQARKNLITRIELWEIMMRDILYASIGMKDKVSYTGGDIPVIDVSQAYRIVEKLHKTKRLLHQNIHPKLLIEHILLSIP